MLDVGGVAPTELDIAYLTDASKQDLAEAEPLNAGASDANTSAAAAKPGFVSGEVLVGLRTEARVGNVAPLSGAIRWPNSLASVDPAAIDMV